MGRILQSLFFLLEYERELICEPNSNKFLWKKAKQWVNEDFLKALVNYQVIGPKDYFFMGYNTINFIERNLEGIVPEEVDLYNITLGKLFKWL